MTSIWRGSEDRKKYKDAFNVTCRLTQIKAPPWVYNYVTRPQEASSLAASEVWNLGIHPTWVSRGYFCIDICFGFSKAKPLHFSKQNAFNAYRQADLCLRQLAASKKTLKKTYSTMVSLQVVEDKPLGSPSLRIQKGRIFLGQKVMFKTVCIHFDPENLTNTAWAGFKPARGEFQCTQGVASSEDRTQVLLKIRKEERCTDTISPEVKTTTPRPTVIFSPCTRLPHS